MPNLERPSESLANYCSRPFYNIKKSLAGNILSTFMSLQESLSFDMLQDVRGWQTCLFKVISKCMMGTRTLSIFLMTSLENFYFILCKTTRDEDTPPPQKKNLLIFFILFIFHFNTFQSDLSIVSVRNKGRNTPDSLDMIWQPFLFALNTFCHCEIEKFKKSF